MATRSYLYVPADRRDRLVRAFERGADALIVDLEDSVATDAKISAREFLASWLPGAAAPVWIRVNAAAAGVADVQALAAGPNIAGFCLAKASVEQVESVSAVLDQVGSSATLCPLLEDAAAVLDARAIAAGPRVVRLQLGEADLRAQLGISVGPDEREMLAIRSQVVLASAAAGLEPPLAPVSTVFTDLEAFAANTRALHRLGFFGRACIHPAQVAIVNREFTPTAAEIEQARSVLARLAESNGAATAGDSGEMIDEAVARAARRVLDQG